MTALITKYRPKTFKDVIGQDAVVKSLEAAVKKDIGSAYLFTGPPGVGKTTLARIVAAKLGCTPADLQEHDAATKTGIEDIREIVDSATYRPLGDGAKKGIIVDEVHALSKAAVTALLKSLEDPPPWVRWFLCTTDEHKLPKAIKTRCLTYNLKEVHVKELVGLLDGLEEAKDLDKDIIELCAEEAGGSPRQALANLGVCLEADGYDDALDLLRSAKEAPAAFDLAKALMQRANWSSLTKILADLKETNPESVRHVVRAYMTTVLLKNEDDNAAAILKEFIQPFSSSDGLSPLVLACWRATA